MIAADGEREEENSVLHDLDDEFLLPPQPALPPQNNPAPSFYVLVFAATCHHKQKSLWVRS